MISIFVNYKFLFRLISDKNDPTRIEVKTHPFQQTSQPQEFNIGTASCALFIGMDFVLLPITLAVDMVYDREVNVSSLNSDFILLYDILEFIYLFFYPTYKFFVELKFFTQICIFAKYLEIQ